MAKPRVEYVITARDQTARAFASISANVGKAAEAIGRLTAGLAITGAGAFGKFTADAARSGDEVNKLSTQLGISTEALSEYQFVAQQTGVDFRQFTLGIQRATRRIAEAAQGTGEARNALKELGLSAIELNRLSPDQQFERLADALNGVTSESDQVRLAFKLFDSEGVRLLRTIKAGSGEIAELRAQAQELGLTLSQDAADGATDLVDAFGELKGAASGLGNAFVAVAGDEIAAGIRNTADAVSSLGTALRLIDDVGFLTVLDLAAGNTNALSGGISEVNDQARRAIEIRREIDRLNAQQQRLAEGGPNDLAQLPAIQGQVAELSIELANLEQAWRTGYTEPLREIEVTAGRLEPITNSVREFGSALSEISVDVPRLDAFGNFESASAEQLAERLQLVNDRLAAGAITATEADARVRSLGEAFAGQANSIDPVLLAEYQSILQQTTTPAEELANKLRTINELVSLGTITQSQADEQVRRLGDSYEVAAGRAKKLADELSVGEELQKKAGTTVDQFGASLTRAFVDGSSSASDVFARFVDDIISQAFELLVVKPILDSIFGGITGGAGGSGFLGGIFGRAVGGSVRSGQPVLVGEQGPELFVPQTAGQVNRNAGGGATINFNINTLDGKQAAAVIAENRNVIIGIVRDGFNRAGRSAPVV